MGKKGPMPNFKTIDEYIAHQSPEAQALLQELRDIIKEAVPESEELLNAKVPTVKLIPGAKPDQQIMMAAYAKYLSFYPFAATVEAFVDELKEYKQGKGSVNFPYNKPLPKDLIIRMVKFRQEDIKNSQK